MFDWIIDDIERFTYVSACLLFGTVDWKGTQETIQ